MSSCPVDLSIVFAERRPDRLARSLFVCVITRQDPQPTNIDAGHQGSTQLAFIGPKRQMSALITKGKDLALQHTCQGGWGRTTTPAGSVYGIVGRVSASEGQSRHSSCGKLAHGPLHFVHMERPGGVPLGRLCVVPWAMRCDSIVLSPPPSPPRCGWLALSQPSGGCSD